jgi:hypothetical protein
VCVRIAFPSSVYQDVLSSFGDIFCNILSVRLMTSMSARGGFFLSVGL